MDPQYAYASAPMNTFPMQMPPMLMAQGGLAAAAQQVQGQGRGGDSMLVHMTPGEVKGLQALAMAQGGSLTINPTTGLPEANFLKRILPMVLGAGLTIASGGALTPLMAAGIVGAGYGVAKGSLKEGLMAGLGAYGGAGLGAGLTGAGMTTAAGETAKQVAADKLKEEALKNAAIEGTLETATAATLPTASQMATSQVLGQQTIAQNAALAGQGVGALATDTGRQAFMAGLPKYGGTAATMAGLGALTPEPAAIKPGESAQRPYKFEWNPQEGAYTPSPTPGDTAERLYFKPTFTPVGVFKTGEEPNLYGPPTTQTASAPTNPLDPQYLIAENNVRYGLPIRLAQGGELADPMDEMSQDGGYKEGGYKRPKARSLEGEGDLYKFAHERRDSSMRAAVEQNFAKGGLGAALPPRFLSGGGDGMSDSIRANIDGKQEARLADGEFVVPADVVSHLGNGSSKAGAKKLYAMMDKIRKARTGKTRQAPEVNAAKYMPA